MIMNTLWDMIKFNEVYDEAITNNKGTLLVAHSIKETNNIFCLPFKYISIHLNTSPCSPPNLVCFHILSYVASYKQP